jgi:hypothetical protein
MEWTTTVVVHSMVIRPSLLEVIQMELHDGNGYGEEYGPETLHRDAHGWAIAGGTPAIQRTRIASEMFGRSFDQRPPRVSS